MSWPHVLALLSVLVGGCDRPAAIEDPSVAITPLRLPFVELEGTQGALAFGDCEGSTILHFWATWCAPCRRELPGLLRLGDEIESVRVVAVTDEPWGVVEAYFAPDEVPRWIERDPEGVLARTVGVGSLPDTYIVDVRGVARRRVADPLDWTNPTVRAWVESLPAEELR